MDLKLIKAFVFNRLVFGLIIAACFLVTALDFYLEYSQDNVVKAVALEEVKNNVSFLKELDAKKFTIDELTSLAEKLKKNNTPLRITILKSDKLKDDFQRDAFKALTQNPDQPYYNFQDEPTLQLRYAVNTQWGYLEIDNDLALLNQAAGEESNVTLWVLYSLAILTAASSAFFLGYWKRLKEIILEKQQESLDYQKTLTESYERFFPRQFLYLLNKKSVLDIQLGDQTERQMSVLFSDIRNFTSMTELKTPAESFQFINDYLRDAGPIIRENNGFIDKYFGDSILALFDVPDDALKSTLRILDHLAKSGIEFDETANVKGIRTGIHFGWVMVGTVGEEKRMDGTVISDVVNAASRLEQLNKIYGTQIIISEQFLERLTDQSQFKIRFIDHVYVVGKVKDMRIFEVYDMDTPEIIKKKDMMQSDFDEGFKSYQNRKFEEAISYFTKCYAIYPEDPVINILILRLRKLISEPPNENWSPIVKLTYKDAF